MLTCSRSFGGQAPLALICLSAVASMFKHNPPHNSAKDPRSNTSRLRHFLREIDWLGAFFSALCITTGLAAMNLGGAQLPWSHPIVILAVLTCFTTAGLFVIAEKYWAQKPLIPPKLVMSNGIGGICLIQLLLCMARFGVGAHPVMLGATVLTYSSQWRKYQVTLFVLRT